ncbi:MAG: hypothetical protein AAF125_02560 [Chloroflexota bacterium]
MTLAKTMTNLGRNDAKLITRDSFLLTMTGYLVFIAVVFRYLTPYITTRLLEGEAAFDLVPYYPLIIAYIAVFNGAMLGGMIAGFLLLGEREDGTMRAMLVTPIAVPTYLLYRVLLPMAFGFALIFVEMVILLNLAPMPLWQVALIALGGAFMGPIAALFFGSFAENKVQGFALMKIVGVLGFLILGAWFVAPPLEYLFGLFPPYWVSKAYWLALEGNPWWLGSLALGVVTQLGLIRLLMIRFRQVIYSEV